MVSRHCKITSDVIGTLAFKQKSALCQTAGYLLTLMKGGP